MIPKSVTREQILAAIAHDLVEAIRESVAIESTLNEPVRADMRRKVKSLLRKHGYPPTSKPRLSSR